MTPLLNPDMHLFSRNVGGYSRNFIQSKAVRQIAIELHWKDVAGASPRMLWQTIEKCDGCRTGDAREEKLCRPWVTLPIWLAKPASNQSLHLLHSPGNVKSPTQIYFIQSESWRKGVGWDLNGLFRFSREDIEDIKPNCRANVQAGLQMATDDVALYPSVLVRVHFRFFGLLKLVPSWWSS